MGEAGDSCRNGQPRADRKPSAGGRPGVPQGRGGREGAPLPKGAVAGGSARPQRAGAPSQRRAARQGPRRGPRGYVRGHRPGGGAGSPPKVQGSKRCADSCAGGNPRGSGRGAGQAARGPARASSRPALPGGRGPAHRYLVAVEPHQLLHPPVRGGEDVHFFGEGRHRHSLSHCLSSSGRRLSIDTLAAGQRRRAPLRMRPPRRRARPASSAGRDAGTRGPPPCGPRGPRDRARGGGSPFPARLFRPLCPSLAEKRN